MPVDQLAKPGATRRGDAKLVHFDEYIDQQVENTRRAVKIVDLATSLVLLFAGVLAFLMVVALFEHWIIPNGFSVLERGVLFAVLVGGVSYFAIRRLGPLLMRRVNPIYAAHTIEISAAEGTSLKNSLVNLLLFRQKRSEIAESVYHTLEEQAAQRLSRVPIEAAVDRTLLIRFGYVLLAVVAIAAAYKVFSPKDPVIAARRVLMPWARIAPASRVNISNIKPGVITVSRGEVLDVSADVSGIGEDDTVVLRYTTTDGQAVDKSVPMKLSADGLRFESRLPGNEGSASEVGLAQDLTYRIEAGDARSLDYLVRVIEAPSILVEHVDYDYPEYTGFVDHSVDQIGDIAAIEGTRITIHGRTNGPIKEAQVDFDADGRRDLVMNAKDLSPSASFVLALRDDRRTPEHASYVLRFTNADNRTNRNPVKHSIHVDPDYSPEAAILAPREKSIDVRLDETVAIEVEARDPDFALADVKLRGEVPGRSVIEVPLLQQGHKGRFTGRYQFKPSEHGLRVGDIVQYWIAATDNRAPQANATESARQQIRIVSPNPNQQPPPDRLAQRDQNQLQQPGREGQQDQEQNDQQQGGQRQDGRPDDQQNDGQRQDGQPPQNGAGGQSDQASEQQEEQSGAEGAGSPNEGQSKGGQQNGDQKQGESSGNQAGNGEQQSGEAAEQSGEQPSDAQQNAGEQPGSDGKNGGRRETPADQQSGDSGENSGKSQQNSTDQQNTAGRNRQSSAGQKGKQGTSDNAAPESAEPSNVSSEGDDDGEAFERIQEHMQRNGEIKDSESPAEPNNAEGGAENAQQQQDSTGSNKQSQTSEADGSKSADGNKDQNADATPPGKRAQESGDGTGAETKGGEQPDGKEQGKNDPEPGDDEQKKSPGGEQTGSKGAAGAGEEQQPQGTPNSQPEMKPSDKVAQSPSEQQQSDQQEPPAGARGKKESDSRGEQGGDRAGGGEEGGGQKSPHDGTGSAGQNQAAEDGAGESTEQGSGVDSSKAGSDSKANGKTGQTSGETHGRGTKTREVGEVTEEEASGASEDKGGERDPKQSDSGEQKANDQKGAAGSANSQSDAQAEDGDRADEPGSTPTGSGGERGTNDASPSSGPGLAPGGEEANLDYARKQTDLVLERLSDQLNRKKVDEDLLKQLGWSEEDLRKFVDRWRERKEAATRNDQSGDAAKRELDEALRSLGLRPGALKQGQVKDDNLRDLQEGYRGPVPLELRERLRAYNRGVSRARPSGE